MRLIKGWLTVLIFCGFISIPCWAIRDLDLKLDSLSASLSNKIIQKNDAKGKIRVAVMPFPDSNGEYSNLSTYVAEELITRLSNSNVLEVVERQRIDQVLKEQRFDLSGLMDTDSVAELGKLLGARMIITGTIMDLGSSVKINARLVTVETGSIVAAASVEAVKDNSISRLLAGKTGRGDTSINSAGNSQSLVTTEKENHGDSVHQPRQIITFDSPGSGFKEDNRWIIQNNKLQFWPQGEPMFFYNIYSEPVSGNYTVSVEASWDNGEVDRGYGLIYKYINSAEYYAVLISHRGGVAAVKYSSQRPILLRGWQDSAWLNNYRNTLKVVCQNGTVIVYVNNQIEFEYQDGAFSKIVHAGVGANGDVDCSFDDFTVEWLPNQ